MFISGSEVGARLFYQPLTARQYVDEYYSNPVPEVKRFINLAVNGIKWDVLTIPELAELFPQQQEFKPAKIPAKVIPAVPTVPQLTEYQKAITILENEHSRFTVNFETKDISCYDLDDKWNDTKGFNRTSRSIKKAWAALVASWNAEMKMYAGCSVLSHNGIRMHTYCGMD